jgi:hypothetical protein
MFSSLCFIKFYLQHFSSIHPLYRKICTPLTNLIHTQKVWNSYWVICLQSCKRRERGHLADLPIDGDDIIKKGAYRMGVRLWTGFNFLETLSKSTWIFKLLKNQKFLVSIIIKFLRKNQYHEITCLAMHEVSYST